MGAQLEAKAENPARSTGWTWVVWTGVVLLGYVLSSGPAIRMCFHGSPSPVSRFLDVLYTPLGWAYERTALRQPLGIYWHLWDPNRFDKDGWLRMPQ